MYYVIYIYICHSYSYVYIIYGPGTCRTRRGAPGPRSAAGFRARDARARDAGVSMSNEEISKIVLKTFRDHPPTQDSSRLSIEISRIVSRKTAVRPIHELRILEWKGL